MSAAWTSLAEELTASGRWGHFASTPDHPVNRLVNGGISAKPYRELLIRALDWPMERNELTMVVRALSEKGIAGATEKLLAFFEPGRSETPDLWAAGNAVHAIGSRESLPAILGICRRTDLGTARQMLVLHLSRFKNTEEVYETLVSLLSDDSVRGHAIEALWRYGDRRAMPAIEAAPVRPSHYEAKAKNTALRRLRRAEPGAAPNSAPPHRRAER
jgi:HEAT repeat protein